MYLIKKVEVIYKEKVEIQKKIVSFINKTFWKLNINISL